MSKFNQVLDNTYDFLRKHRSKDILMPCLYKNPKYRHKNGAWTWEKVLKHNKEFGRGKNISILLITLIVIDFDDKDIINVYIKKFPILNKCSRVDTKKGAHFYFTRNTLTDLYGLYDKARCFGVNGDQVDFKTICSTGTAGVVIVPPSKDKSWVKPI
jgi:hypothetical protein